MMTRSLRSFFYFLLSGLLLGISASHVLGSSNFVRVPLGKGASIEVPKNWIVLSGNQRITIDTFVEAKGYRLTESTLNFAANLYDDRGKTIALVNARFYPENPITQDEARQISSSDLKEIDVEMRKAAEAPLKAMGVRMTNWYGSKMQVINGLHVLVHEHQYSDDDHHGIILHDARLNFPDHAAKPIDICGRTVHDSIDDLYIDDLI